MPLARPAAIAAMIALFAALAACTPENDPRYNGWGHYADKDDGYSLFVPKGWEASDETMPGKRATRFNPVDSYGGDMAGLVSLTVIVQPLGELKGTAVERATAAVRQLTEGSWQNLKLQSGSGTINDMPAVVLNFTGKPLYTGYTLQGRADVVERQGRMFIIFAAATTNSWTTLGESFDMMRASVRLP